jgi:putative ribosome biogenesis GTPase RsgA
MKSYVESLKGRTRLSRGMICKEALKTAEALKIDGLEPNLYRWYNKFVKDMNLRWDNIQKCLIECEEKEKSKSISLSQVDLMENNQQIFKEENGIEVPSMSIENMDVFEVILSSFLLVTF